MSFVCSPTTLIIAKEEATPALSTITTLGALPRLSKPSTPDVVALQELDSAMSDRRRRDLLKQISEFTGLDYQHFFGGLAPINGGKVGPGLLLKKI